MVLHTINATPSSAAFADCMRLVTAADAILLLGDGVYAAVDGTNVAQQLLNCGAALYVLRPDTVTRGIVTGEGFAPIDMAGFVALSEKYPKQLPWY